MTGRSARSLARMGAVVWASHVLLAIGLFAPCMTITPHLAPHDSLARWLGLLDEPKTYSIVAGVLELLKGGNVPVGLVLLVFSVLFPVFKLVILRAALGDLRYGREATPALRFVHTFGKYSMVDVFVVALLVLASQSLPGGTAVEVRWGVFAFAAAALLPIPVAALAGR